MSDFICINDRNQLPKYIPGYDTPEKAEAASLAMSANDVLHINSTGDFAGPGSFIKTITLVPTGFEPYCTASIAGVGMQLWVNGGSAYTTVPPPITLNLGITSPIHNVNISSISGLTAIVTGYLTPVV